MRVELILSSILDKNELSGLTGREIAAVALATSMTSHSQELIQVVEDFAKEYFSNLACS